MDKIKIEGGNICLDLNDLLYEIWTTQKDEFDQVEFVKSFAWMPQIREEVINILKNEFARENYNPDVHQARKELLDAIKEKEIEYYADKIASQIENARRWRENYYKIYHYLHDIKMDSCRGFLEPSNIDFDYRKELEKIIIKALKEDIK